MAYFLKAVGIYLANLIEPRGGNIDPGRPSYPCPKKLRVQVEVASRGRRYLVFQDPLHILLGCDQKTCSSPLSLVGHERATRTPTD